MKRGGVACGEEGVSDNVVLPLRHLDRVTCPSCLEQLMLAAAERVVAVDPRPRREVATMPQAAAAVGRTGLAFMAHLVALDVRERVMVAHDIVRVAYAAPVLEARVMWCAVGRACAVRPPKATAAPVPRIGMHEAVHEAMKKAHRFGESKVFISSVWTQLEERAVMWGTLAAFKAWLVEENRSGMVRLARADLVSAMDPEMVSASEVEERGASWHFILDEVRCPKCSTVMMGVPAVGPAYLEARCVNPRCTRSRRG